MYIIVGLGNPGRKYDATRHNVGFHAIDLLAHRNNIKVNKIKYKALCGEGIINGKKVLLVKPQTFMNLSGQTLLDVVHYYKPDLKKVIVIYDDIDVKLGAIRIREKGSGGSHNGMKSIIYLLQDDGFPRVRIGIGAPEGEPLSDYVLKPFNKEEVPIIREAIERSVIAVETIVNATLQEAMNKYNG